jgi:hypothetical protein
MRRLNDDVSANEKAVSLYLHRYTSVFRALLAKGTRVLDLAMPPQEEEEEEDVRDGTVGEMRGCVQRALTELAMSATSRETMGRVACALHDAH